MLLLPGCFSFAQTLSSTLNKKTLALGEAAELKIHIINLQNKDVLSAPKDELLPFHFEEIKDSSEKNADDYTRIIEFAIFTEGKFTIPALEFRVGGELMRTIPYEVEVVNTAQKGDQINDIMKNKQVKLGFADYWELYKFYLLAALALIALIFIIIYVSKYAGKQKSSPAAATNKTLKELDALKKKGYIEKEDYRLFYVELIEISRNFLSRQYRIPADVLLTDDLLNLIKEDSTVSPENEKVIRQVFQRGDMVKFAKTFPDRETMQQDFSEIRSFVKRSVSDIEFENLRKDV